ncbi:MAG: toxin-antitoxin system YwqK family antitoxin [Flavobacteriales bacterium]|nr:toxin-antitoxin system YwqK family antitoxin [Flavobacteriales bacterium]
MLTNLTSKITWMAVALILSSSAWAGDFNRIDNNGMRQGYWVIKGQMLNDASYKPDATVEEGNYKDNRKEGVWRKFWPNGNLRSEITFEMGRPYGAYKVFYENSKIEEMGNWIDSKNIGAFKRWYSNGNPQQDFTFDSDGKRDGWQKYYHETGKTALELQVENGQESGICKRYNEDGILQEERKFNNGVVPPSGITTYKPAVAEIAAADTYNKDLGKTSVKSEDSTNAALKFKPNGHNELYDNSGNLSQSGLFKEGRLWEGKLYRYNNNGILIRIEVYSQGKYIGTGVMTEGGK